MGRFDIFDTIDSLRKSQTSFCIATVIRTADVTSAKAGSKAVITQDNDFIGHLGGACVVNAVRDAAMEALRSGSPTTIRVKPSDKVLAIVDADGAQVYQSGCPSGGTVDLLIEPYTPAPMLVVFGDTPISRAIARHGALAGYRIAVPDTMELSEIDARFTGIDLYHLDLQASDFVVVSSQGQNDLASLKAALNSPCEHVAMVASKRKAQALVAKLEAAGMPAEKTARLASPAGLDIGAIDPHEIAISVLSEVIARRRSANLEQISGTGLARN